PAVTTSVQPTTVTLKNDGTAASSSSTTVQITSPSAAAWSVTTTLPSWLPMSPLSGTTTSTGNGYSSTVTISAQANTGVTRSQSVNFSVGGSNFSLSVTQYGDVTVSPTSDAASATGESNKTFVITTLDAGVAWTAVSSDPSWLTVTPPA